MFNFRRKKRKRQEEKKLKVCLKGANISKKLKLKNSRNLEEMEKNNIRKSEIFVVIPAFNESKIIQEVISEVQKFGYENIIVVDDGSTDDTHQKAKETGVWALKHKLNRGKGAATRTGIEAAKTLGAGVIVTIDGDGQHDPGDIENLVRPIEEKQIDVALGTRSKNLSQMPWHKALANHAGNAFTWYLFGLWVSDSQSGFRAYSREAAFIINTKADRYEYDSEVIREIYIYKLRYKEIPIQVRYTEYSMGKTEKQGFVNGIKTLYRMIWSVIS